MAHDLDLLITFPTVDDYQIFDNEFGQKIEVDGYNNLLDPGKSMLPSKTIFIAIPPGSSLQSINIQGIGKTLLPGTYRIVPVSNPVPYDMTEKSNLTLRKQNQHGRETMTLCIPQMMRFLLSQDPLFVQVHCGNTPMSQ